jgi:hypothetical protein
VITVTLTFKTLTHAIKALREIPENLLAETDLGKMEQSTISPTSPTVPEPAAAPVQPIAAVEEAPAPAVVDVAPEPAPEPKPLPEPKADFNYADLQRAVLTLYAMDKVSASTISAEMGHETFKKMPAALWPEAHRRVMEKIAELAEEK